MNFKHSLLDWLNCVVTRALANKLHVYKMVQYVAFVQQPVRAEVHTAASTDTLNPPCFLSSFILSVKTMHSYSVSRVG